MSLRDVIDRHAVTNVVALRALVRQILQNPGAALSLTWSEDEEIEGVRIVPYLKWALGIGVLRQPVDRRGSSGHYSLKTR